MNAIITMVAVIAAIAMVGAIAATLAITIQEAHAATTSWCYSSFGSFGPIKICFANKGDCQKVQRDDQSATSGCFKRNS